MFRRRIAWACLILAIIALLGGGYPVAGIFTCIGLAVLLYPDRQNVDEIERYANEQ